jgi:TetR/AcrR family transcriptional regulator, repressor of fatR-cypB operon
MVLKNSPPKDKREAIVDAMLDLIVERGFHDAPMSLLAKRSGASAGVIYHYFASKDEVIHAVYVHVKSMKRQSMLEGQIENASFEQAYLQMYVNIYNFYRTHLRETRFLDLYENSTFCALTPAEEPADIDPAVVAFLKAFRPKSEGGLLKELPLVAIHEFSFGTARQLAKKDQIIEGSVLRNIAIASWKAISDD